VKATLGTSTVSAKVANPAIKTSVDKQINADVKQDNIKAKFDLGRKEVYYNTFTDEIYFNELPVRFLKNFSDCIITRVDVFIDIPFNGTGSSISVGTLTDPSLLVDQNEVEVDKQNYVFQKFLDVYSPGDVYVFINHGWSSQGKVTINIEYAMEV